MSHVRHAASPTAPPALCARLSWPLSTGGGPLRATIMCTSSTSPTRGARGSGRPTSRTSWTATTGAILLRLSFRAGGLPTPAAVPAPPLRMTEHTTQQLLSSSPAMSTRHSSGNWRETIPVPQRRSGAFLASSSMAQ
jgi:hypothetical protein